MAYSKELIYDHVKQPRGGGKHVGNIKDFISDYPYDERKARGFYKNSGMPTKVLDALDQDTYLRYEYLYSALFYNQSSNKASNKASNKELKHFKDSMSEKVYDDKVILDQVDKGVEELIAQRNRLGNLSQICTEILELNKKIDDATTSKLDRDSAEENLKQKLLSLKHYQWFDKKITQINQLKSDIDNLSWKNVGRGKGHVRWLNPEQQLLALVELRDYARDTNPELHDKRYNLNFNKIAPLLEDYRIYAEYKAVKAANDAQAQNLYPSGEPAYIKSIRGRAGRPWALKLPKSQMKKRIDGYNYAEQIMRGETIEKLNSDTAKPYLSYLKTANLANQVKDIRSNINRMKNEDLKKVFDKLPLMPERRLFSAFRRMPRDKVEQALRETNKLIADIDNDRIKESTFNHTYQQVKQFVGKRATSLLNIVAESEYIYEQNRFKDVKFSHGHSDASVDQALQTLKDSISSSLSRASYRTSAAAYRQAQALFNNMNSDPKFNQYPTVNSYQKKHSNFGMHVNGAMNQLIHAHQKFRYTQAQGLLTRTLNSCTARQKELLQQIESKATSLYSKGRRNYENRVAIMEAAAQLASNGKDQPKVDDPKLASVKHLIAEYQAAAKHEQVKSKLDNLASEDLKKYVRTIIDRARDDDYIDAKKRIEVLDKALLWLESRKNGSEKDQFILAMGNMAGAEGYGRYWLSNYRTRVSDFNKARLEIAQNYADTFKPPMDMRGIENVLKAHEYIYLSNQKDAESLATTPGNPIVINDDGKIFVVEAVEKTILPEAEKQKEFETYDVVKSNNNNKNQKNKKSKGKQRNTIPTGSSSKTHRIQPFELWLKEKYGEAKFYEETEVIKLLKDQNVKPSSSSAKVASSVSVAPPLATSAKPATSETPPPVAASTSSSVITADSPSIPIDKTSENYKQVENFLAHTEPMNEKKAREIINEMDEKSKQNGQIFFLVESEAPSINLRWMYINDNEIRFEEIKIENEEDVYKNAFKIGQRQDKTYQHREILRKEIIDSVKSLPVVSREGAQAILSNNEDIQMVLVSGLINGGSEFTIMKRKNGAASKGYEFCKINLKNEQEFVRHDGLLNKILNKEGVYNETPNRSVHASILLSSVGDTEVTKEETGLNFKK